VPPPGSRSLAPRAVSDPIASGRRLAVCVLTRFLSPNRCPLRRKALYRFLPSSAAMSLVMRPTFRCAAVSWSCVTPHRFIQNSTALRSLRSRRSLSMKPRLSLRPAMNDPVRSSEGVGLDEVGKAARISRRARSYTRRQSPSARCARQELPHAAREAPKRGTSRGPSGGERGGFRGPSEMGHLSHRCFPTLGQSTRLAGSGILARSGGRGDRRVEIR
jgi:hypothetical protein